MIIQSIESPLEKEIMRKKEKFRKWSFIIALFIFLTLNLFYPGWYLIILFTGLYGVFLLFGYKVIEFLTAVQ